MTGRKTLVKMSENRDGGHGSAAAAPPAPTAPIAPAASLAPVANALILCGCRYRPKLRGNRMRFLSESGIGEVTALTLCNCSNNNHDHRKITELIPRICLKRIPDIVFESFPSQNFLARDRCSCLLTVIEENKEEEEEEKGNDGTNVGILLGNE